MSIFHYKKERSMCRRIQLILFGVCVLVYIICVVAPAFANEGAPPANAPVPAVTNQEKTSTTEPQAAMDPNALAVIPSDSYDFGSVYEGNDVFHDFIVKNGGTSDLKIIKVKSG
jgi:hypothetical protein